MTDTNNTELYGQELKFKVTDKGTGYLLVRAYTQSEWYSCNCAYMSIDEETIARYQKCDQIAKELKELDSSFGYVSYYEGIEYLSTYEDIVDENKSFSWIEFEEGGIEQLDELHTEQQVDTQMIRFYGDGNIRFVGYGKHTSKEFWTDAIHINLLEEQIQNK